MIVHRSRFALSCFILWFAAPSFAVTQVSNLSEPLAVEFVANGVGATASSFTTDGVVKQLTSVTVSVFTNTSGTSELRLRADAGGTPGSLIESLGSQSLPSNQGQVLRTYNSAGSALAANTTYWLTLGETGSGDFQWGGTTSTNQSSPGSWTIGDQAQSQATGSSTWSAIDFGPPNESALFAVDAITSTLRSFVINFGYRPGPDGMPGSPDDIPYTIADIDNFGGLRLIDDEYAVAGVHFSGASLPYLGIVGGGFDSDNVFGPGTNTVLQSPKIPPNQVVPYSVSFDVIQSSITMDVSANINSLGTSVPLTFRRGGATVGSQTLTGIPLVAGRFTVAAGVPFDQIDFGVTGPSSGGIFLDNLQYLPEPGWASGLASGLGLLAVVARRSASQRS